MRIWEEWLGDEFAGKMNFTQMYRFLGEIQAAMEMPTQDVPTSLRPFFRTYEAERNRFEKVEKARLPSV